MSHCLASMSRWFVGSSSSSRSLPANRMRVQLDAPALAARERGDRQVEPVGAEAEAGRDAPHLGVGRVAAGVAERVFGVAVRAHVARRRVVGHALVQLVEPAAGRVEPARREHVRERGAVEPGAARRRVLRQVADRAGAARRHPRRRAPRPRAPSAARSCRRRCGRRDRPCRRRAARRRRRST